jgi:hypothetical protein
MTTHDGAADWPTETRWHCQRCDISGTVTHAADAAVWEVVGLLAADHAQHAPGCHALNSLYKVRVRSAHPKRTPNDGGHPPTSGAASVQIT